MHCANEDPIEDDVNAVGEIADAFVQGLREGRRSTPAELQARFPEYEGNFENLLTALSVLEEASFRQTTSRPSPVVVSASGAHLRRLGSFRARFREISSRKSCRTKSTDASSQRYPDPNRLYLIRRPNNPPPDVRLRRFGGPGRELRFAIVPDGAESPESNGREPALAITFTS